MVIIMTTN